MAHILRDLHSPVCVTITRARSPTNNGKTCHSVSYARNKSAERRNFQTNNKYSNNLLGHDLNPRDRSASPRRSNSARGRQSSCLLEVPSKPNNKNNQSLNDDKRSRSHSPLDWIHRDMMPSCSPAFERVLSDMLSETELSPQTSDAENEKETRKNIKQKKPTSRRNRAPIKRK